MINTTYFIGVFLIFLRVTSFFIISNVFFPNGTPKILKAMFSLIFSFSLIGLIDYSSIYSINSNYYLIIYCLFEVINGLILGLISNIAFEVLLMAGSLIDVHIGLSMVNTIDPNSKASTTITGNLLHYVALVIFFIIDGHHMLIKSLIETFTLLPIGKGLLDGDTIMIIIEIISNYFIIGLKIALPIIVIRLLTDILMGLIFAYIYYDSNNIFSTIIIHSVHNLILLILQFIGG